MKFLKNVKTDEFMATVTRTASKYGYKLKKASPTIMIFVLLNEVDRCVIDI